VLPYGWSARLETEGAVKADSAMNVLAWLPGSDPDLRGQYVLFTAHMDHIGIGRPVDGDSIYNGADDDASGTATILELAHAYASASRRPRRSLVFMAVSGEEKGLLGSTWYTKHPVFPLDRTVADINIDMIGRNWKDTVAAVGKKDSSLGALVDRVASLHPELDLTVVGDRWPEQHLFTRSDHINFARKGVPVLFFFSGLHQDYHQPSDEADRIEYDKTARVGRLIYYLGLRIADADRAPTWKPDAYRRVVEGGGSR
jgi:Zn-dependent M28 family amino/carboxypeptidase